MTNLSELTTTALLALCTLWIVCGFVLLQTAQAGLLTPGWTALLAFFAVGHAGQDHGRPGSTGAHTAAAAGVGSC